MKPFTFQNLRIQKSILGLFFLFLLLLSLVGCQKTGSTGPQGPAGPTGPTGPAGAANVIYSDWFTPGSYTLSTVFSINNLDYNKPAPGITQEIIDKGVVLTYAKLNGYNASIWPTGQVSKMPVLLTYISGGTQTDTWSAFETVGNLRINFTNNTNLYNNISTAHSFRYIIIPGGVHGSVMNPAGSPNENGSILTQTPTISVLRTMTYDQICDYLKIDR